MPRLEFLPVQHQRLNQMLEELRGQNRFWTQRLEQAGLGRGSVDSLEQWRSLPLLTKSELVADQNANPLYGTNLTYPLPRYSRLHQTSGTTGRPMYWLDTPQSWDWFMDCWTRIYQQVGLRPDDVLAFPFSFGPFIGFWAAFEGALRQGNRCLAMGGLGSETRLKQIINHQCTVVCCTPTYAMKLADVARAEGIDLVNSSVRALIVAGEPGGSVPEIRQRMATAWGARVFDHWGMTDLGSLGIESEADPGNMRILETEGIAEVLDPATGQPTSAGDLGELVMTNLGRWGQPVLRYRTGDLVRARIDGDAAGTGGLVLEGGVLSRADDMLIIRGNNVFPSSVEALMREFPEVVEFRMARCVRDSMPQLRIEFEALASISQDAGKLQDLLERLSQAAVERLSFRPEFVSIAEGSLPRHEFKSNRVVRNPA
jgi:phenylacetate-CoA ligase